MFRVRSGHQSRRDFLQIGSLALGSLSLPGLFEAQARAAALKRFVKDKSVVLLFLQGGPPQQDTFDPKPDALQEIRSVGGEIKTSIPGLLFGGHFPKMAALADRMAVVHSFASGNGGHEGGYDAILQAGNAAKAVAGSLYARAVGSINSRTGVPTNTLILPEAIDPTLKLGNPSGAFTFNQTMKYFATAGSLGADCVPFSPAGGSDFLKNLTLNLPADRFDDRKLLLAQIDQFKRRLDTTRDLEGMTGFQQQAVDVLLKGISKAFDLNQEDAKTVGKYDTSKLLDLKEIHKGGKNFQPNFSRTTNLLGKQMLLARRLCEAGCGFVTVVDSCWDFHDDGNNPPAAIGMPILAPQADHAVAAFLEDVDQRGLSDQILLIITGEMGRSPGKKGGKNGGGTGHWGNLTPLVLAGGGLKMGQVIGKSDAKGGVPVTERYLPDNLLATVFHTLFDVGEARIAPELPKTVLSAIVDGKPIRELI
jgi:uncharacterized protein (DUF1501 family)